MGQDQSVVEESVMSLENNHMIQSHQAQAFLKDYNENCQSLEDVRKFYQSHDLAYFLKYFIHNRYHDGSQIDCLKSTHGAQKNKSSKDSHPYTLILDHYAKMMEMINMGCQGISESCLGDDHYLSKQKMRQVTLKILGIKNLQVVEKRQNNIVFHHCEINISSLYFYEDKQFMQYDKILISRTEIMMLEDLTLKYSILLKNQSSAEKQFLCYFHQQSGRSLFSTIMHSKSDLQEFTTILSNILEIILYSHYEYSNKKKLSIFSRNIISSVIFMTKVYEQKIREVLGVQTDADIQSILSKQINKNIDEKSKFLTQKTIKKERDLKRQKQYFDTYLQKMEQNKMIIQLNKFGKIKLCYGNPDHKIINKIKQNWNPYENKAMDLFKEYKQLYMDMKDGIQGKLRSGTIVLEYEDFSGRIYIDKEGKLDRVHILEKTNKIRKEIDANLEYEGDYQSEEENKPNIQIDQQKQNYNKSEVQSKEVMKQKKNWVKLFNKSSKKDKPMKDKTRFFYPSNHVKHIGKFSLWNQQPIQDISKWDLDILPFKEKDLDRTVLTILKTNNLFNLLVSDAEAFGNFQRFIAELRFNYNVNKNSFHNYHHGVNVMHTSFMILQEDKNDLYLSDFQKLCILFSSLCHDVGHTGFNNAFEIATFSPKAMDYNDVSPLQNYHAYKTFDILRTENKNFLSKMQKKMMMSFKKNVVHNILNTDMKQHFFLLQQFKKWKNTQKQEAFDNISTLTALIVHTSDFGGTIKDFAISQQWSRRVNMEFTKQYEKECELNLPPTAMMANLNDMGVWSKNQFGFLKVIVFPLFKQVESFYGTSNLYATKMCKNLENNMEQWKKIKESYQISQQ